MSNQPKDDKKPLDYYQQESKDNYRSMNYLNSTYEQSASVAALIFIGEQLARIADAMEKDEVSLDEAVKIWGAPGG
ncbi:MAG: hypothetical protein WC998_01605 [Candidatus Paceibacterota bacterium]|jgi:hypothetical protein